MLITPQLNPRTDSITLENLHSLLTSDNFTNLLAEVVKGTLRTGNEWGFDIMKEFQGQFDLKSLTEGDEKTTPHSFDSTYSGDNYVFACLHSHSLGYLHLPNADDLGDLGFMQLMNSLEKKVNGHLTKPIGMIAKPHEEDHSLAYLVLFQSKNYSDMSLMGELDKHSNDIEENYERISSDLDFCEEHFRQFLNEIIVPYFNTGILVYRMEEDNISLLPHASTTYMGGEAKDSVEDVLKNFVYEVKETQNSGE